MNLAIVTDRASIERGTWAEFSKGEPFDDLDAFVIEHRIDQPIEPFDPPAAWSVEAPPCDYDKAQQWCHEHDQRIADCGGSGKQRHTVQVLCERCEGSALEPGLAANTGSYGQDFIDPKCEAHGCVNGLVTVEGVRATVEWGPAPVIAGRGDDRPPQPYVVVYPDPIALKVDESADPTELQLILPLGVDPVSLVGQWARGGRIEAA